MRPLVHAAKCSECDCADDGCKDAPANERRIVIVGVFVQTYTSGHTEEQNQRNEEPTDCASNPIPGIFLNLWACGSEHSEANA